MILCATVPPKVATSHTCFNEIVLNFCPVFYNGWTISTPNFTPMFSSYVKASMKK